MILGVVLLYVGAVLAVNGLWLIGQAFTARTVARAAPAEAVATPTYGGGAEGPVVGNPALTAEEAATGEELGGEPVGAVAATERSPLFIQNREVAILNVFTGFIGVAGAVTYIIFGNNTGNLAAVRAGGYILLFAFTYLWVAYNQYANAGGRAFGWYCLFVAVTAIPAGVYTLQASGGHAGLVWLGVDWFCWSLLWAMFWALLTFELPIAFITGAVALLEGIGTSWALAIAVLEGKLTFL